MRSKGLKQAAPAVFATVLVVLLIFLAGLQYRWLGQLSEGERSRAQSALEASAQQVASGVDQQLTQLVLQFSSVAADSEDLAAALTSRSKAWRADAEWPELLRRVLLVEVGGREIRIKQLDTELGALEPVTWPDELSSLEAIFGGLTQRRGDRLRRLVDARQGLPVFLLPLADPFRGRQGSRHRTSFLILWIDEGVLVDRALPALVERFLPPTGDGEYRVKVVRRASGQQVFSSGSPARRADVELGMFAVLPPDRRGELRGRQSGERADARRGPPRGQQGAPAGARGEAPRWRLQVTHPSGSLETAIDRARRRNLALSLAVLALLGSSAALLVASSRRAQRLARQRLEFVAGVSHELMTPLAAMRSAGQNLADGVVREPAKVARYGRLIDREGWRLSEMVGQVMEFAGMEAGRREYQRAAIDPSEIVRVAIEDCRPALEERGVALDLELPDGLPRLWADGSALRRALQNLILNAVKYGGEAGWIGVTVRVDSAARSKAGGERLCFEVADRGPGIPTAEQKRVFEPFYRGRAAAAGATGGSGLGLSLVRRFAAGHGGGVELESAPGAGCRFTVWLPLTPAEVAGDRPDD